VKIKTKEQKKVKQMHKLLLLDVPL